MQFEHPHLLWFALVLVPALVAFFWWTARVKRQLVAQFIAARLIDALTVGVSAGRQKARVVLLISAVALGILALARPQIGFSWEEARSRGIDVVVAIDTSKSMLAADVAPNRLRRAQLAALDLKRLAKTDRIGLVAFAGGAFLQCPLTLDDEVFRQSVEALDVNIIPQGGTALAEAIAAAKGAFKSDNDNHKVLVFFTDGEDNEGTALDAAKAAGKDGFRIFTVGVGTANGELLRVTDTQGRTEFLKDSDGNAVKSRLDEKLLRGMAQETGGFFMLLSGANTMSVLYERGLAPLPKSDLASQRIKRQHERYQWLLGAAILLLLIEWLLPDRVRAKAAVGKNPAVSVGSTVGTITVLLALMAGFAAPVTATAGVRDALVEYCEGNFALALEGYERLLLEKPGDARLHFNAGTAAFQGANYGVALQHLNAALTNADLTLQQRAYYNLGGAQFRMGEAEEELEGKQKRWEEALKSYQNAAALRTNDVDAVFNLQFVRARVEEVKQMIRFREQAKRAKEQAEEARRRRNYRKAIEIMEAEGQKNPAAKAKEFESYIQRLKDIDAIANPGQP